MKKDHLPDLYTERDIVRARRKAKVVGWLQGGVAVLAVGIGYSMLGWLPTILVLGLVAFVVYKLIRGPKSDAS